jgi:hypothetical protein
MPHPRGGRSFGTGRDGRGWAQTEPRDVSDVQGWLAGRLPDGWFTGDLSVNVDRDEITVVGTLAAPQVEGDVAAVAAAETGRISRFREETRDRRMEVAREAEHRYGRKVAWGARCGNAEQIFTSLSVPVMTRLRQNERQVLDTLVDAGVARSRSDALAWCVRLVGEHAEDWLSRLRDAMQAVEQVRAEGPGAG